MRSCSVDTHAIVESFINGNRSFRRFMITAVAVLAFPGAGNAAQEDTRSLDPDASSDVQCPITRDQNSPAGYLPVGLMPDISAWFPPPPKENSTEHDFDTRRVYELRSILHTERGYLAAYDDVFSADRVLRRAGSRLGLMLNRCDTPNLVKLLDRVKVDANHYVASVKKSVPQGGRLRPFVKFPDLASCMAPIDMAGRRDANLVEFHMDQTGSYPSSHAMLGMIVGMMLSTLVPEKGAMALQWGLDFGDSRVICGFHYPSDVSAGRLAASVVWAQLLMDAGFRADLEHAKSELAY